MLALPLGRRDKGLKSMYHMKSACHTLSRGESSLALLARPNISRSEDSQLRQDATFVVESTCQGPGSASEFTLDR